MNESKVVAALAALAHRHRLRIFRLLVKRGPSGMPAGEIAERVGIGPTNTSFHLKELDRAGLLRATRDGRYVRYAVHVDGMRKLLELPHRGLLPGAAGAVRRGIRVGFRIVWRQQRSAQMSERPYHVLFLCTHNSARSIIAECVMNRLGKGKFVAHSAGSQPRGTVHPLALALLERLNYDIGGLRSKSWQEFAGPDAPKLDFVFTVCDDAARGGLPGLAGPAHERALGPARSLAGRGQRRRAGLAFADTHRMLNQRIGIFCSLPVAALDRLSLQRSLDAIGRGEIPALPKRA